MYCMPEQHRRKTMDASRKNTNDGEVKRAKIKEMVELPGLPSVGCFKKGEPQDLINVTKEDVFREFVKRMKDGR